MPGPKPTLERTAKSVRVVGVAVVCAGTLMLAGWLVDVPFLRAPLGGRPLEAGSALSCLLLALALLLSIKGVNGGAAARLAARALAAVVVAVGVHALAVRGGLLPMSPTTAVIAIALATALLLFDAKVGPLRAPELIGLLCSTTSLACAFDVFLGLFDDDPTHVPPMSGYGAALFYPLSQGIVLARPTYGWMAALSDDSGTSRVGQRLLSLVAPIVLGLSTLCFLGAERGLFDMRTGIALMGGASVLALVLLSWRALVEVHATEQELLRARAIVDAIVENIPHMIFVKDAADLRFLRFNRAGEQLLGMKREALLGKSDRDFFPPEQAEHFIAKDRETLAGNAPIDIEAEEIDAANGKRWLHTIKVPVAGVGGNAFLLGISEDITERRRKDEELRRAKEAAEATSKELEAFSYSVSHDLRAPLRSIDGFSQAVLEDAGDKLDPESLDHLQRVRAAAQKMAALIDDLLNLSRVSRQELRRERVDVSAIAASVVAELRRLEPTRAVDVVIQPGLTAIGDPRLVEIMLENLIGNAWKFTSKKADAHIEIGATDAEGERRFYVKDDGAGFDMAYAGKLFGAFQRLHAAGEFAGTGIGLATVQRIAHRHGGHVSAWGEVGRGATFTFTLDRGTLTAEGPIAPTATAEAR